MKKKSHVPVPPKANLYCSASDLDNTAAMDKLFCDCSDKDKTVAALKVLLDSDVGRIGNIPLWIKKRNKKLGFPLPISNTFRAFLWKIRCLIEPENSYVPPEVRFLNFLLPLYIIILSFHVIISATTQFLLYFQAHKKTPPSNLSIIYNQIWSMKFVNHGHTSS